MDLATLEEIIEWGNNPYTADTKEFIVYNNTKEELISLINSIKFDDGLGIALEINGRSVHKYYYTGLILRTDWNVTIQKQYTN